MKLLIIFMMVFSTSQVFGLVRKEAVVRDENFKAIIKEVELEDLINEEAFEGKYFKIVKGKNNEAIRFDDKKALQLKAATAYYHLNMARKYFTEVIGSSYVKNLPQIIVRIDLTNVFNELGHFANDNLDPQFNNALSIPSGIGYAPKDIPAWNSEIWFRPSKEINIKDMRLRNNSTAIKDSLTAFRSQTHMANLQQFFLSLLSSSGQSTTPVQSLMRFAGSSLLLEVLYQSSDLAAEFFTRKIYRLDSALVPEIIYHEFSHIALSGHLELTHSTPVNEGLADYFAGKIAKSKKLATKIRDYNLFSGKEVRKKQQYREAFESGEYANTDFVFGLLWNIGETVGVERESRFMFDLSRELTTNSSIREELIKATLETCENDCKDSFVDKLRLYKIFNSKNL